MDELLTCAEMYKADAAAIAGGMAGYDLMRNAGAAVADAVRRHWPQARRVGVLCGVGNNGGDGFVAARLLADDGFAVSVYVHGDTARVKGDARLAYEDFCAAGLSCKPLTDTYSSSLQEVYVDALLGAGLQRDVDGDLAVAINLLNDTGRPVLAVDLPSGIDGDTGARRGSAVMATRTVTFFRRKPGHVLLPGRKFCGPVEVADIGIKDNVLAEIGPRLRVNNPQLWSHLFEPPPIDQHKYNRGHVVCVSGGVGRTGAARLAARGALRAGAGLVTVATPPAALLEVASQQTAVMSRSFKGAEGLGTLLADRRLNACVIGPGLGLDEAARANVHAVLKSGVHTVLDADALTGFASSNNQAALYADIAFGGKAGERRQVVMTPHEGEFNRLFDDETLFREDWMAGRASPDKERTGKIARTERAARAASCVVVHKGADTVIAGGVAAGQADETIVVNDTGSPHLATAGSGDVLAGIVAALLARDASGFDAACASVWLHGRCGELFGPGLIAEDIPEMLPQALAELGQ